MHFDRDLDSVIGGKLGVLDPIRSDYLVPLPVQNSAELGRPWAGHPVGCYGVRRIARAAGEVHRYRNTQLFRQKDGFPAGLPMQLRRGLVGVQQIPVTAQSTDCEAVIIQSLLEI